MGKSRIGIWIIMMGIILGACSANHVTTEEAAQPPAPSGVVYEIFVGSFADSNGDGIGDLKGIEGKLEYLLDLGVREIWLTPIHPSPSYHHYDVLDYLAVDPAFGTMEDMDALLKAMHERDMKLYLDLVINHTSSQHPWTKEHPEWYAEKNFFGEHMPELDLDNAEVREEIWKIVAFWLGKGVDGFRLDAALHYHEADHERNTDFLSWLNETVKGIRPDAYIVAEVWTDFSYLKGYYASGVDSFFDFGLSDATGDIASAVKNKKGALLASRMADHWKAIHDANPAGIDAVFLSNHDQARSGGYFTKPEHARLAAQVLLLSPGKPFLYYGEELGMRGSGRDENKRMAMPWGEGDDCASPADCDYTSQIKDTVKSEEADSSSLLHHYKNLFRQRASLPSLTRPAHVEAVDLKDPALFCLHIMTEDGEEMYIVHNFSDTEKTYRLPGSDEQRVEPYSSSVHSPR